MGGGLGIKTGEYWAYRHGKRHALQRALVLDPGTFYEDDIAVRLVDEPNTTDIVTRRPKLPCKWEDKDTYIARHPEIPREMPPVKKAEAPEEDSTWVRTKLVRSIIHEEVSDAVGVAKLAYTYKEAAVATGLSVSSLRGAVHMGRLNPSFFGNKPLFLTEELRRFLDALPYDPWPLR
jgi:hypothetical protein